VKIPIKVTYDDGREVRTVAKLRDVVDFERRYQISYTDAMGRREKAGNEEWWAFLAWSPLHRSGEDTRDFEAFVNSVDDLEVLPDEEPDPAPFEKAPTDESSPGSPPQE
jgi:hypothetical protein